MAEPKQGTPQVRPAPWSELHPKVVADLHAGLPLVTLVEVPLCANSQIRCGGQGAGDPASPAKNLYWGRGFGVRRYFDETARGWRSLSRNAGNGRVLEELVYTRVVPGKVWGLVDRNVEQLLVLRAVHGEAIESAVEDFYELATRGGTFKLGDDSAGRHLPVHVAGYAGHNRLMDGYRLPVAEAPAPSPAAIPSFVIACKSAPYFKQALLSRGSQPLVMTRDLIAPEGYVIEALVNALGDNVSAAEIRTRVVRAYARWQRIPESVASTIFAR
ncbi:MAG: hypothetical protein ACOY0T_28145 [Myxococcota bacterium]